MLWLNLFTLLFSHLQKSLSLLSLRRQLIEQDRINKFVDLIELIFVKVVNPDLDFLFSHFCDGLGLDLFDFIHHLSQPMV